MQVNLKEKGIDLFSCLFFFFLGFFLSAVLWLNDPFWIFLQKWQTLIAGSLAFLGAFWTVSKMQKQIDLQTESMRIQKKQKERLARALLSDAISDMSCYARACFGVIRDSRELPKYPLESLSYIKQSVEYFDDLDAEKILNFLSSMQVFNARLEGYSTSTPSTYAKKNIVCDLSGLGAQIYDLFDLPRYGTKDHPFREEDSNKLIRGFKLAYGIEEIHKDVPKYNEYLEMLNLEARAA